MTNSIDNFDRVAVLFMAQNNDVELGRMMSSPGLKCNGKVFAFHCRDGMGFRLGPQFCPDAFGLRKPMPLSPFKTKPPLQGWYIVAEDEHERWQDLATAALQFTRALSP